MVFATPEIGQGPKKIIMDANELIGRITDVGDPVICIIEVAWPMMSDFCSRHSVCR